MTYDSSPFPASPLLSCSGYFRIHASIASPEQESEMHETVNLAWNSRTLCFGVASGMFSWQEKATSCHHTQERVFVPPLSESSFQGSCGPLSAWGLQNTWPNYTYLTSLCCPVPCTDMVPCYCLSATKTPCMPKTLNHNIAAEGNKFPRGACKP